MGFKYVASNPKGVYFTTSTIVQWIDLFTRRELQEVVIDSLKILPAQKGINHICMESDAEPFAHNFRCKQYADYVIRYYEGF